MIHTCHVAGGGSFDARFHTVPRIGETFTVLDTAASHSVFVVNAVHHYAIADVFAEGVGIPTAHLHVSPAVAP